MATGDHTADLRGRHDGVDDDPARQPGPVTVFTPDEIAEMNAKIKATNAAYLNDVPVHETSKRSSKGKFAKYAKTDYGALINERQAERKVVTAEATRAALERAGSLSFEEQKEQIRRANSILLSSVLAKIENGTADPDEDVAGQLAKCSNIAKQWMAEERAGGNVPDPNDIDALKRAAKRAG